MELILNGFQSDLSSISSEIQTLQHQSVAMNQRLKNRQAVRGELSQFVDEMVVPEMMIQLVCLVVSGCCVMWTRRSFQT